MSVDSEILNEFRVETNGLLRELEGIVEKLEGIEGTHGFPDQLMTEFAQKIDRIMGAVKTLSLMEPQHLGLIAIGKLAELCKSMGYQAAQKKEAVLLPLFSAFWADTIEVIDSLMKCIESPEETRKIAQAFPPVLQKRLAWLKSQVER